MAEAGKLGPMPHTPGSGKTDLDSWDTGHLKCPDGAACVQHSGLVQSSLSPHRYFRQSLQSLIASRPYG
jgi:hypothetical protein